MKRKALVFIFTLITIIMFLTLGNTFYIKTINEHSNTQRYLMSMRAFWTAETGISEALNNLKNCAQLGGSACTVSGDINYSEYPGGNYHYTTQTTALDTTHYQIDSLGSKNSVLRKLVTIIQLTPPPGNRFPYAIETKGNINIKGSASVIPDPNTNPNIINPYSSNWSSPPLGSDYFEYLFGFSKPELKSYADNLYQDAPNNVTPVEGITWVSMSENNVFQITANTWSGSGILIIEGDVRITGGDFDGIIYIIGNLDVPAGNPQINGTIVVENLSSQTVNLRGNFSLTYDSNSIQSALNNLAFINPSMVAWWEETP